MLGPHKMCLNSFMMLMPDSCRYNDMGYCGLRDVHNVKFPYILIFVNVPGQCQ